MPTPARVRFLHNLAAAFLSGDWGTGALQAAARQATGQPFRWLPPLVTRVLATFPNKPDFERLLAFLDRDSGVNRVCRIGTRNPYPVVRIFTPPRVMGQPPVAAGPVDLPQLVTSAALAAWLGLSDGKLYWYADPTGRNRKHPAGCLRTYRHRWAPKPRGRSRLLEIPTPGLKRLQRQVLDGILARIPVHPAAHGFCSGRSIVTNATPHCGKRVVVRFDLADFFPSVPIARVCRTFRTFGYPEPIARLLTGLCTTRLPPDVWDARPNPAADGSDHATWQRLASRHLPQGAPTSPALANLAAHRLDRRLARLATRVGADYTRYADDLTFSGGDDFARRVRRFSDLVARIVGDEGFTLNHRKTRVMRSGGRQHVTGVVVNARPNVPRVEFDRLKAVLTNCARHGPLGQNRENRADFRAHLAGRVAHVSAVNPVRGRKLWAIFDRIGWCVPGG